MNSSNPLLLVDGNNLLMRAFYAGRKTGMARDGILTGPLLIFINTLAKHIREEQPSRVAIAWDGGKSEKRTAIDGGYKGTREFAPNLHEFRQSVFTLAHEFCALAGVYQHVVTGVEADDLISSWWAQDKMYGGPAVTVRASDGQEFWVSPEDAPAVQAKTWSMSGGYPRNGTTLDGKYQGVHLHRFIMGLDSDDQREVDHWNGDPLDNRRSNLRILTHAENQQNRSDFKERGHSKSRGVTWREDKKRWWAYGSLDGKQESVGYFLQEETAIEAAAEWRATHMPFSDRSGAPLSPQKQGITILSSDKDFLQLIGRNPFGVPASLVRLSSGGAGTDRWTEERLREEYGFGPMDWPLVTALTGDVVDHVPGVPGVGPKTAAKILKESDWSLEEALSHPRLRSHVEQIRTSLKLVDLRTPFLELDPPPPWRPLRTTDIGWTQLAGFLDLYGLTSVKQRLTDGVLWQHQEKLPTAPAMGRSLRSR